MLITLS